MLFESEKLWSFILEVYKIARISTIFHLKMDDMLHINKWHFYREFLPLQEATALSCSEYDIH